VGLAEAPPKDRAAHSACLLNHTRPQTNFPNEGKDAKRLIAKRSYRRSLMAYRKSAGRYSLSDYVPLHRCLKSHANRKVKGVPHVALKIENARIKPNLRNIRQAHCSSGTNQVD